ncbi:MAG: reverse transcriptase/maturase family protein [Candidatus Paceibacterota bacterium]|jgi:retron-type reverse transcriptase
MTNKKLLDKNYNNIISVENLLLAWREFVCGKKGRKDVQEFQLRLMDNILNLHDDLTEKKYKHSEYEAFNISDPKPRNIHKAKVRDRLLHHALYRILYPFFDKTFIAHSYSCRVGKGLHKALDTFRGFSYKVSDNHTKTVWVLKCDIRKFFASIDHKILIEIIKDYIPDENICSLMSEIVGSFYSTREGVGLPLGNLTSQLLVNIYMNKFDQFMKHKVKVKYYIRYADDFVIISKDKKYLEEIIPIIRDFLFSKLHLELHPNKISISTIASGVDFLGWVHFTDHRVIRTVTKKRMIRGIINKKGKEETVQSYLGMLGKGNTKKLREKVQLLVEEVRVK